MIEATSGSSIQADKSFPDFATLIRATSMGTGRTP
jgi:hypothetical protein